MVLCWVTYRFGRWAFGEEAGLYAGVALATSAGLFLFTRILIPDATLTATITGAIWAWLSLLEPEERRPLRWSVMLGACLGTGLLLKGLIAVVFPVLAGIVYMALTRQLLSLTVVASTDTRHGDCYRFGDCRAVACARNPAQSALLCVFYA